MVSPSTKAAPVREMEHRTEQNTTKSSSGMARVDRTAERRRRTLTRDVVMVGAGEVVGTSALWSMLLSPIALSFLLVVLLGLMVAPELWLDLYETEEFDQ